MFESADHLFTSWDSDSFAADFGCSYATCTFTQFDSKTFLNSVAFLKHRSFQLQVWGHWGAFRVSSKLNIVLKKDMQWVSINKKTCICQTSNICNNLIDWHYNICVCQMFNTSDASSRLSKPGLHMSCWVAHGISCSGAALHSWINATHSYAVVVSLAASDEVCTKHVQ